MCTLICTVHLWMQHICKRDSVCIPCKMHSVMCTAVCYNSMSLRAAYMQKIKSNYSLQCTQYLCQYHSDCGISAKERKFYMFTRTVGLWLCAEELCRRKYKNKKWSVLHFIACCHATLRNWVLDRIGSLVILVKFVDLFFVIRETCWRQQKGIRSSGSFAQHFKFWQGVKPHGCYMQRVTLICS